MLSALKLPEKIIRLPTETVNGSTAPIDRQSPQIVSRPEDAPLADDEESIEWRIANSGSYNLPPSA